MEQRNFRGPWGKYRCVVAALAISTEPNTISLDLLDNESSNNEVCQYLKTELFISFLKYLFKTIIYHIRNDIKI